ncbi:MAG: sensor histidine kinase [Gammaproteobacteria bacterium]
MSKRWRTSLFAKITWLAIAASSLMFIIIAVFVSEFFEDLRRHHHTIYGRAARVVALRVYENPLPVQIDKIAHQHGFLLRYQSPFLQHASSEQMPQFNEVQPLRRTRGGMILARSSQGELVALHRHNGQRLMIMLPEDQDGLWGAVAGSILLLVATLIFLWGGFYFYQRHMLAPLLRLRRDMEAVGRGQWRQTEIASNDEIGELAAGFNQMQDKLRTTAQAKESFLANASHELRSPLARLRVAAEFVEDAEVKRRITADIMELDKLTGDIMQKTRLENFTHTLTKTKLSAAATLDSLRDKYPAARFSSTATAFIEADDEALSRALGNLLDNAAKFSRGEIHAECADENGGVVFRVRDNGRGVPADDLPHLFEPFYRADASRSRQTGGFGLGMSIVKAIAEAHDGKVRVQNAAKGGGLIVELWIPSADSRP